MYRIVVSDTAPLWPPKWGGPKRIWELYARLPREQFCIDYVGCDRHVAERYVVHKRSEHVRECLAGLPPHYYVWERFHKQFLLDLSFDLFYYFGMKTVPAFGAMLESLPADVLISSHPWASPCMRKKPGQVFIYDAHNCEYALMRSLSKHRWFSPFISAKTRAIEAGACSKSDAIFVCSEEEKQEFVALYRVRPEIVHIVPNGTTVGPLPGSEEKERAKERLNLADKQVVLFIGAYFKPNNDAARFIVEHLAPAFDDVIFYVVGSVKDAFRIDQVPENVHFAGMVSADALSHALTAADVAINAISAGSGTNIKMLDYLGSGLPTVVTPCGARGLGVEHREHVYIAELDDFADGLKTVLGDSTLREQLSCAGYALAKEHFDWSVITATVKNVILELLRERR